jgi:hypothetical protein
MRLASRDRLIEEFGAATTDRRFRFRSATARLLLPPDDVLTRESVARTIAAAELSAGLGDGAFVASSMRCSCTPTVWRSNWKAHPDRRQPEIGSRL